MPHQPLRMIDANLNRCSEGLRVLEDVARFVVDDLDLSQRLRTIRHDLARETRPLQGQLLSQRDVENDVGSPDSIYREKGDNEAPFSDIAQLVRANARRVQESLRVLEELARLPELASKLSPVRFAQARFNLYALEQSLYARVSRRAKLEKLSGLYVILDREFLAGRDELETAGNIIAGGAKVIQLRDKRGKRKELLSIGQELRKLCDQKDVLFIINDYLDLALAVDADGLHVGQEDLPLPVIRKQLPVDSIIGCSVRTVAQAMRAQDEGADYVAIGSIFPTGTKKEVTVVGVDIIRELKQRISLPVVAIGGINQTNIGEVVAAGADAVAVISAVLGEEDVKRAVEGLIAKMNSETRRWLTR